MSVNRNAASDYTAAQWPVGWSGREHVRATATRPMWAAQKPAKPTPKPVRTEGSATYQTGTVAVPTRVLAWTGVVLLLLVFILGAMMDHTVTGSGQSAMADRGFVTHGAGNDTGQKGEHRAPTAGELDALSKASVAAKGGACWFEWEGNAYGVYDIICDSKPAAAQP